ncbi:SusC/RagA family TonB-linked outer membrane protein [uncultured Flavobacterium sp.]|uniref:SusC/RagA family TonB-linked outer membrane protein n=1 Tax=uncultured Flavobacterium sp. TaxID=165435 RepID=UPI0025EA3305|nr:SusC/RagA family TonB-linked outer membrane protein [uncultured Flavobacterium sp.]
MRKTLLNITLLLTGVAAFSQVPPQTANDTVFNDSIFFDDQMEEVVLIGYGARKAGAITGSVSQIRAADIMRTPAQSAIQAIQGKAAGVNIITNDEPGGQPTIRIRGLGTITGARDPLYVIDGIETSGLNGINPNDIASIDILKDASSLAIYGQKGSNGVIIITTKKGRQGQMKISYDAYYGQKFIQRDVEMANSFQFAYYNNYAFGSSSLFNSNQPYDTNWLDEITDTGEVISNSVSISGAGEHSSYYFSAGNYKEKGILNGSEFERTNVLFKNEIRLLNDKLKISPFVNLTAAKTIVKPVSAFTNAYKQSPIVPVRFDNGRWGAPLRNPATGLIDINGSDRFNTVANPAAQLYYHNEQNKDVTLIGSINAELEILEYLKFNSNFGATSNWGRGYTFTPSREVWYSQNPTGTAADYLRLFPKSPINTLQQRRSTSYRWNWDNFATFSKMFGSHNVTVVAGLSRTTSNISEHLNGTRWNVPVQSNYWKLNFSDYNGTSENPMLPRDVVDNAASTPIVSVAYFARAEYDYLGKYLLSASVRREGISAFQEGRQWDTFPSVSAGWVMTEEGFMDNVTFLDNLKIRGGYGKVGNGYGGNPLNQLLFRTGALYPFGNGTANPGSYVPYQVDPGLTWEVMTEIDLGIDFTTMNNRLSGTIDLYSRESDRLILPIAVPAAVSPEIVYLNAGKVTNSGAELSLKWNDNIGNDFNYWVGGNFSYNKNELKEVNHIFFGDYVGGSLNNGETTKQVIIGQPLGTFYLYDVLGYNAAGAFELSENRIAAGSYLPDYTYGLNLGFTYRSIDFSVDAYGVGGNKLYNGKKAQRMGIGENIEADLLSNFWTPSNPNAANPAPLSDRPKPSTYYLEDGDYLRINNITLGYTLPPLLDGLDKVRVYATAINPFLFTKFSGFSPEISGNNSGDPLGTAGIELDAYPTNKTFLFGLNVSF